MGSGRDRAQKIVLEHSRPGPEVGCITFPYISLAKISHVALPNCKGGWEQSPAGSSGGKGK